MTIIVFLVDTSASMCQRAHVNGVQKTYLDIAKGAVETFLKFRQRSQDCMGDRYMLLTFEDPPNNVKAGWKENHATFMNELKNLQSNGLTTMGEALKNAFDLLNLNRMQSGIDTYGQGRCPFYLEPSVIIVLTDGGKYTFRNGVHQEIILPLHAQMPGTKLTKEPFRWDQRLFSLVLRMPGHRVEERADGKVSHDDSMIEKMCEVTGGRSYKIKTHYVLNQCIESLVQKVQPGVVIHFDQLITNNGDTTTADLQFQATKRMIYVPKQHPSQKTFPVGYWPIPEPYWPDPKLTNLPPRDAHPKIKIISPCCDEPPILRNFPIDKYELEASPLTLQILSKKESNKVWPLIVSTGMQGEMPFGYLKPNSTLPIVHLYVLPYNYQMLLPLINDLFHKFNLNPPNDWVYKFTNYVKTIPQYYCPFLRRALATMPNVPYQLVQYILPENLDSYLCPAVANYLKQMKNTAKQDQENLCHRVVKQLKQPKPAYHQLETAKLIAGPPLQKAREIVTHPMLKDTFNKVHSEIVNYDNYTIVVPTIIQTASTKNYRNPYDIPRRDLVDEIARMREIFFREPPAAISLVTKDSGHCLPISDMGNYQEYLKNKETPLRELEPTNVRQHMFGNPYKKDKNMVMVDEADLNDMAPLKSGAPGPHQSSHMKKAMEPGTSSRLTRKRKAGPIRKDYVFKRSALDVTSSASGKLARDGAHMLSDLSSDDESSTGFATSSDTEDDTEGCLVMAFDGSEGESADSIGFSGTSQEALDRGVNKVAGGLSEKVPERQATGGESDTGQSSDDSQPVDGTGSPAGSPAKYERPNNQPAATAVAASQAGTAGHGQHNYQPSSVNHPSEDGLAGAGDAKARYTQPAGGSIVRQSKPPAPDDPSKEQVQDASNSSPSAKKRQLEQDGQPVGVEGQSADGDGGQMRKKPRLQQQESPAKARKVSSQQYPEQSEPSKNAPLVDGAAGLPECSEHTLSSPVAKLGDAALAEPHAPDRQRGSTERSEMPEQSSESQQQQMRKPVITAPDEAVGDCEASKQQPFAPETLEQPTQSEQGQGGSDHPQQAPVLERADGPQEQQRDGDQGLEAGKQQPEQIDQSKAKQSKPGKHQRLSDEAKPSVAPTEPPEQPEAQQVVGKDEPRLKMDDDSSGAEHAAAGQQPVPVVESSVAVSADHSAEPKVEQHEPTAPSEQRKPPPQQQQQQQAQQQQQQPQQQPQQLPQQPQQQSQQPQQQPQQLSEQQQQPQSQQPQPQPQTQPPQQQQQTQPQSQQQQTQQQTQPQQQKQQQTQQQTQPQQLDAAFQQRPMQRNQSAAQWSFANPVSSIADASSSDMADVQKISNILKTCHNGADDDRDKNRDAHYDDGSTGERPAAAAAAHEGGRARLVAAVADPDAASPSLANGSGPAASAILTNGCAGAAVQPTYNWDYNVALFSCVDDEEEQDRIEEHNMKMRSIVFREIRRPGRNYTELIRNLELVQGSRMCKKKFVGMCINEARRFRRIRMVKCLQEWWELGNCVGDDSAKMYLPHGDSPPISASTGAYPGEGFAGFARSARPTYVNSGITSVYSSAEFSHNNHHFAEGMDDSLAGS